MPVNAAPRAAALVVMHATGLTLPPTRGAPRAGVKASRRAGSTDRLARRLSIMGRVLFGGGTSRGRPAGAGHGGRDAVVTAVARSVNLRTPDVDAVPAVAGVVDHGVDAEA